MVTSMGFDQAFIKCIYTQKHQQYFQKIGWVLNISIFKTHVLTYSCSLWLRQ